MIDLQAWLPTWAYMTVLGFSFSFQIVAAAFLLVRIGRSPLWALLLMSPVPIGIWLFALVPWPRRVETVPQA